MVSINNNVSGLGSRGVSRPSVDRSQQVQIDSKKEFSKVLTKSVNSKPLNNQKEIMNYSPLMQRYGVNKINEIKDIAKQTGVNDLTNQDFDNAIRYGRSLIADYIV